MILKRIITIAIVLVLLSVVSITYAQILEDSTFDSTNGRLTAQKKVIFSFTTMVEQPYIKIDSCSLEKKINGRWQSVGALTPPSLIEYNTDTFGVTVDYSNDIGTGTYRVRFVPNANGHTLTCYTNSRTF